MIEQTIGKKNQPAVDPGIAARGMHMPANIYKALAWLLAIGYGAALSQIPAENFKDFSNYLIYAEYSWSRLLWFLDRGVLETLANEPVWLMINAALGALLPPEAVVRTIIFASSTLVAGNVFRAKPDKFVWLVLFLMLPNVLKNHLIHLRQGLAVAFFLWGWFSPHRFVRLALIALTPFIHASFFFVLLVFWVTQSMVRLRLGPDIRAFVLLAMGVSVAVALGWLAAALGARQANEYQFSMAEVSGLGFLFWLSVFALMSMNGRRFLREHAFETGLIVFYLATYWLVEVTGRIFESGLLLVLLAGLALNGWRKTVFLVAISVYGALMWLISIGQPAAGFGIG